MRKRVFTLMCVILFLQALPMVSAQAQLPPPDYVLRCDGAASLDVDPETATPPSEIIGCEIFNEESYSLELSISSETHALSIGHDDSIVVGANAEKTFEVTINAEDRMKEGAIFLNILTEVTKTGEFDYSDDEPKSAHILVQILQYAAFTFEPQQADHNQKLIDDEYFEVSYIMTNNGNAMDKFAISTFSYATPICDPEQTLESSDNEASGCVLMTPVSDDCNEELVVERMDDWSGEWVAAGLRWELDVGQSFSVTFRVSSNIGNASCWPTDSDGNNHLEFTHEVGASSEFVYRTYGWGGHLVGYDHSPIWIERTVDVTKSNDEGTLSSAVPGVPGFGSPYLVICLFLAAIIHNRKNPSY